ncbi:accessory gene regulator B family protein [Microaceticoccus formicicus]|uniref:accessory gene regulator B family protein n=1 Tax=Microaceticoccus formicicus TaxID=3118105 RepID=UPI003CD04F96|nr:accessory gene regulator B family protein [Peptoniphilaceae bacterium AMB_02]
MQSWFRYLINNNLLDARDINKIEYAIESLGLTLLNLFLILIISRFLGIAGKTILLIVFIYPLRSYTGGYHAKTRTVCTILSVISIILCSFIIDKVIFFTSYYSLFTLVTLIIAILIYRVSPRVSPNKPLTDEEIVNSKNMVGLILILDLVLYFLFMKIRIVAAAVMVSFGLVYILLVLDKIKSSLRSKEFT